ncbi:hypothetical protein CEXT_447511 [Caerostris extrusa]|uniref:Uncharacterized protein n=1 Tax=Caerostris extrusa TaxID=172846 RepID=A0AAV4N007_CAEEX|nr:hypothetical protein CEXT_447511 [Caerostris extrusa]
MWVARCRTPVMACWARDCDLRRSDSQSPEFWAKPPVQAVRLKCGQHCQNGREMASGCLAPCSASRDQLVTLPSIPCLETLVVPKASSSEPHCLPSIGKAIGGEMRLHTSSIRY